MLKYLLGGFSFLLIVLVLKRKWDMSEAPLVKTLYSSSSSSYIQAIGDFTDKNYIALPMKSGKLGIFKLSNAEWYYDFGMTLTSGTIKFTGKYKDAD